MHQSDSVAAALLSGLGGPENVLKLENCMTRVRVEVVDDRRVDIDAIKRVEGVKGYIMQGRQHQLIAGPGAAAKIVDAMRRLLPNAPGEVPRQRRSAPVGQRVYSAHPGVYRLRSYHGTDQFAYAFGRQRRYSAVLS